MLRNARGLAVFGRLTTTVSSPTGMVSPSLRPATSLKRNAGDLFSAITRSNENTTAFAVTGRPVLNLTPGRSLNVTFHVSPASRIVHDWASRGLIVVRSSPSNVTRVSYAFCATRTPLNS